MKAFLEANRKTLDLYTNAITKEHGQNHPEVFEVRKLYLAMQHKMDNGNWEMQDELEQLAAITNNFAIPSDACETLTQTYQMFQKLNELR
ncbi:MAG: hypothetical protein Q4F01_05520 [Staphylococcus rostri]|uniref:hypothetical protein n=1 Tax=Staphylococcus rostri TaxID=522262 RepID=UPI0026E0D5FD|nr:hypothetical protein [Staphylococcus rostri]MDO5375631.1 hypothetical protein [Staphylococcus rostri]